MTDPSWIVLFLCLIVVGLFERQQYVKLKQQRRVSSRFPMFAVRDELHELVAEGKLQESDTAYQAAYTAVNRILHLDTRLELIDLFVLIASTRETDEAEFQKLRAHIRATVQECPEFGECIRKMDIAVFQIAIDRTSRFQFLVFRALVGVVIVWRFGASKLRMIRTAFETPGEGIASATYLSHCSS